MVHGDRGQPDRKNHDRRSGYRVRRRHHARRPTLERRGGTDGNLWFTEYAASQIGRITTAGVVTEFNAGITPGAQPANIALGPDGNLWFTEFGIDAIGKITTAGVVTQFSAGVTPGAGPAFIAAGPDGNLWFTENTGNRIGRITRPASSPSSVPD